MQDPPRPRPSLEHRCVVRALCPRLATVSAWYSFVAPRLALPACGDGVGGEPSLCRAMCHAGSGSATGRSKRHFAAEQLSRELAGIAEALSRGRSCQSPPLTLNVTLIFCASASPPGWLQTTLRPNSQRSQALGTHPRGALFANFLCPGLRDTVPPWCAAEDAAAGPAGCARLSMLRRGSALSGQTPTTKPPEVIRDGLRERAWRGSRRKEGS